MGISRRRFIVGVGGVASAGLVHSKIFARVEAPSTTELAGFDPTALRDTLNADGEFPLAAHDWSAKIRPSVGSYSYDVVVAAGHVMDVVVAQPDDVCAVTLLGSMEAWPQGFGDLGLEVEGDDVDHRWPYQSAILRLAALVRGALDAPVAERVGEEVDREFDTAVGRYVYVRIRGIQYRVYFEETGQGIPMVLQHTAGSDSRQWRHLLEDRELQKKFRLIAYDLRFHGRSLPPTGVRWWAEEYRRDTAFLMDSIVAISDALKLHRPIYMGCSVGGYLAPDLAYYHPDKFRAVIGINSAIAGTRSDEIDQPYTSRFSHPRNNSRYIGSRMYMITSPDALEAYRRETAWIYSQGGPGIFGGDLYYFSVEHNLIGKAHKIDTSKVGVHLLSGEYDPTAKGPGEELAQQIKGATYDVVKGGSHFVMSDDYPRFRRYLVPVLEGIHAKNSSTQ